MERTRLLTSGALGAAAAASICCIGPLLLVVVLLAAFPYYATYSFK